MAGPTIAEALKSGQSKDLPADLKPDASVAPGETVAAPAPASPVAPSANQAAAETAATTASVTAPSPPPAQQTTLPPAQPVTAPTETPSFSRPPPLARAEAITTTLHPPSVAARDQPLPFSPHGPGGQPQPVINDPNAPPYLPPPGNENMPGPRMGKLAPYIGQQAGTITQPDEPAFIKALTPSRAYNSAKPYPFAQAFAHSVLEGIGPIWQALRSADMVAEASKFKPDPTYNVFDDPQVKARPDYWEQVMESRSARETRFRLNTLAQWAEENQRLAQNGLVADAGYGTGLMLDPMNWVGLGELEKPLEWASQTGAKVTLRDRGVYGIAHTAPAMVGGEALEQGVASGLDPTRPNGSFAGGLMSAVGVSIFLGLGRGFLAGDPHLPDKTQRLATETDTVNPVDPDQHAAQAPLGSNTIHPVSDFDKLKTRLMQRESGGDVNATGPVNPETGEAAQGIMQVEPSTARGMATEMGDEGTVGAMNNDQLAAWLKQERPGTPERVFLPGLGNFHGAELVHDADRAAAGQPAYAIKNPAGYMPGEKGGDGWFATEADAIARAQRWDHRVQVVRKGQTNSEVYGTHYLHQMVDKYGDQNLALAAYNAGPGAVDDFMNGTNLTGRNRGLLKLGDPRKGEISSADFVKKFPYKETRDYVDWINNGAPPGEPAGGDLSSHEAEGAGSTSSLASGEVKSPKQPPISKEQVQLLDKDGKPVDNHADATFVKVNPLSLTLDGASIIDEKGNHLAGAPLAEGTPGIRASDAIFLDSSGNVTKSADGASRVIDASSGRVEPYNHFVWRDAGGARMSDGEGFHSAEYMSPEDQPAVPRDAKGNVIGGMARWAWKNRAFLMKEAVDWGVDTAALSLSRIPAQKRLGEEDHIKLGQSVGARHLPGRVTYKNALKYQGNTIKDAFGLEKVATGPNLRLANSPSPIVRDGLERLTETGWSLDKNELGRGTQVSAWAKMKNMIGQVNVALEETGGQYWRYVERVTGKRPGAFERITTPIWGTSGVMPLSQFYEEVGKAKRYLGTADEAGLIPEAVQAAQMIDKRVYKPIIDRADASGALTAPLHDEANNLLQIQQAYRRSGNHAAANALDPKINELRRIVSKQRTQQLAGGTYRPDYLNRVYDQRALSANGPAFIRTLRQYGRSGPEAQAILDTLQKTQPFTPFGPDSIGRAASLHYRSLADIPDKALEPFLVHDISSVMHSYVRQTGIDVALAENFGGDDMNLGKHIADVEDDYHRLMRSAPNAEAVQALERNKVRDIQDIRDLRDMVRGTFGLPTNPQAWTSRAIRIAKQFNALTQLTGFISALPDLARIPMVHGLNMTLGAPAALLADGMKGLKMAKRDARLAGEAADFTMAIHSGILSHVSDSFANSSRVERLIQHMASVQPALDGMAHYQDILKTMTSAIAGTRMIEAMQKLVNNKATRKEGEMLAAHHLGYVDEHGVVDDAMIRRILDQYNQHGLQTGSLKIANTDLWHDDPVAAELFQNALGKQIRTTIAGGVTPGEIPTWMAGRMPKGTPSWVPQEIGTLLGQYRSYGFTSLHRILIPGLQQRDRQFLIGAASMVGLGLIVAKLQAQARGEDWDNKSWGGKFAEGVDRSGILGWAMDVNNALEGISFGKIGLRPALGVGGPGDLNHAVGAIAGPTGSTAMNLVHSMFGNPADPGTRNAQLRLMPLHNIWQTRALMNHVTETNQYKGHGPGLE